MEHILVQKLIEKKYTIAFAESCTGGMCAARLIDVSDASKVLAVSFVTYHDSAKVKYLGVKEETIEKYNVVSEDVAYEMAQGVAREANSTIGVGITGVAGPTGGSVDIPVGTVCFGFFVNGATTTERVQFGAIGRNQVRKEACDYVYKRLLELI